MKNDNRVICQWVSIYSKLICNPYHIPCCNGNDLLNQYDRETEISMMISHFKLELFMK